MFVTCALATVVSSCLGCTPVIALGESFVRIFFCSKIHTLSINSKLRTGWCSRGRSNRFDCCFIRSVYDSCASVLTDRCKYAGLCNVSVLVILGVNLMSLTKHCDFESTVKALPSYLTIVLMPFLMSIDRAILAGLCAHVVLYILEFVYVKVFGTSKSSSHHDGQDEDEKGSALERSTTK